MVVEAVEGAVKGGNREGGVDGVADVAGSSTSCGAVLSSANLKPTPGT